MYPEGGPRAPMSKYDFYFNSGYITVEMTGSQAINVETGEKLVLSGRICLEDPTRTFKGPYKPFKYKGIKLVISQFAYQISK